jgi:hypothetical protein
MVATGFTSSWVSDRGGTMSNSRSTTLGRIVRRLLGGFHPGGPVDIRWDGRDDEGRSNASGNYLYTLKAGESTQVRKMTLLK